MFATIKSDKDHMENQKKLEKDICSLVPDVEHEMVTFGVIAWIPIVKIDFPKPVFTNIKTQCFPLKIENQKTAEEKNTRTTAFDIQELEPSNRTLSFGSPLMFPVCVCVCVCDTFQLLVVVVLHISFILPLFLNIFYYFRFCTDVCLFLLLVGFHSFYGSIFTVVYASTHLPSFNHSTNCFLLYRFYFYLSSLHHHAILIMFCLYD